MAERQPHHIPEQQRASHEGGNGSPGLPRTVHESAKPPPPETETVPTSAKRGRGRPRREEVKLQFSYEALRYEELLSLYDRLRDTSVQEFQPESESEPAQPKRKRGRPKLEEFSEEERRQRLKDRLSRSTRREAHREMKQLRATLSAKEIRDVKRHWKYAQEGAKEQITRLSEGSVEFTVWPSQKRSE